MANALIPFVSTVEILCGTSDAEWGKHEELRGRHCIRPAGHDGFHIAQRDDESLQQTWERCASPDLS